MSSAASAPVPVVAPLEIRSEPRLSRVRGGTYSPTVAQIHFTNGQSALTDLIRLNPGVDSYSLDFFGRSPRQIAHYQGSAWPAAHPSTHRTHERTIARILSVSYPFVSLAKVRARLAAEGVAGAAELRPHEAIAATQAAIWHLTNDLHLDTREIAAPVQQSARHRGGRSTLTLTLGQPLELRSYDVTVSSDGPVTVHLERSLDGRTWQRVATSSVRAPDGGMVSKALGVGVTVSHTTNARTIGFLHYRCVARADGDHRVRLADVSLRPVAASPYRNPARIVALYEHLVHLATSVVVDLDVSAIHARRLAGSSRRDSHEEFTPLVTAVRRSSRIVATNTDGEYRSYSRTFAANT
ncbi:TQXA domain-containing protein [Branchiibius hedensis]|uniref:TQXA domain-containing protein n=1 Tax=Branchiibius hedensis TaxID=672460 RepID=A0A2Y8ZKG3_9MICO|nr:TQXA domain-containing protein [Branchiibius hedensis]PWJ24072.1 TQXA domain-containing protein [Branchiibius hedensis]SSA32890.1 TQXA domain-containing protein [Branchiibius hedensis]